MFNADEVTTAWQLGRREMSEESVSEKSRNRIPLLVVLRTEKEKMSNARNSVT
jgi:hypothetical protein